MPRDRDSARDLRHDDIVANYQRVSTRPYCREVLLNHIVLSHIICYVRTVQGASTPAPGPRAAPASGLVYAQAAGTLSPGAGFLGAPAGAHPFSRPAPTMCADGGQARGNGTRGRSKNTRQGQSASRAARVTRRLISVGIAYGRRAPADAETAVAPARNSRPSPRAPRARTDIGAFHP